MRDHIARIWTSIDIFVRVVLAALSQKSVWRRNHRGVHKVVILQRNCYVRTFRIQPSARGQNHGLHARHRQLQCGGTK